MFRKYIYKGLVQRWGKENLDIESGDIIEGYYRTFINKFREDIKKMGFQSLTNYRNFSPEQKVAFKKTMADLTLFTMCLILGGILGGGDDDKKNSWLEDITILEDRRLRADLAFYTIVNKDTWRILNNPTVVQGTLSNILDFTTQLGSPFEVYQKRTGIYDKGESKLKAKFYKALPIVRQIINTLDPGQLNKIYNK
jgi:hypothetical protein